MSYCDQTDIEEAVGGVAALRWITDLNNANVDVDAVGSAIEYATGKIDQYATGTAGTTGVAGALWPTTPSQAKQGSIDIAVHTLYERIRRDVPESIQKKYDSVIKLLEKLAEGKISWVPTEPTAEQNAGKVWYHGPGSTPRAANPRRTRRDQFDNF